MNSAVNSDFCPYTMNPCEITVHVHGKKKVKNVKCRNAGHRLSSQMLTKEQNSHNNIQVFYFSKSPYIIVLVFSIRVQNICSVKVHQCYIRFRNQPIRWILFLRFQLASIWTYIYRNGHLNYLNSWSNRTASFVFYKYTISSHFYPSMALCK